MEALLIILKTQKLLIFPTAAGIKMSYLHSRIYTTKRNKPCTT
jgi:hypothetical protein